MTTKYQKLSKQELIRRLQQLDEAAQATGEMEAIIHDLHVHQEEVRVQNDQLVEMKKSLELSRDRYADLYDFAPISYITLDAQGVIRDLNLTATTMLGIERGRILGTPFLSLVEAGDRPVFLDHMRRCRDKHGDGDGDGDGFGFGNGAHGIVSELRMTPRGREPFIAQVLSRRSVDREGMHTFRTAISDITDLRRVEQEKRDLALKEQSARANAEAKDRFMAILSHELRTPLTPVLAAVTALLQRSNVSRSDRPILEMIRRNVELEARLIEDLLDVTRISSNKLQLRLETVDLHVAIRDVLDMCAQEAHAKSLKLSSELRARKSLVRGDPARLRQVIWNLLKNAIKFTPSGGLVVVRTTNPAPNHVALSVADTGIGIAPGSINKLFAAFEQDELDRRRYGGLGLGLAITKALVESHEGTISATSEGKGRGATFTLDLPIAAGATVASPEALTEKHPAQQRKLRILLVEDHGDTARILSRLLETEGHEVRVGTTVQDGLKLAHEGEMDLIISDLGLPDGSGYDLMKQMRAPVAAIALSGYGAETDIRRSHEAGFSEHITKPVDFGRLLRAIDQVTRAGAGAASPVAPR
jgi:signal transduction histidine kinase/ActR/RegA family two-component response regulator